MSNLKSWTSAEGSRVLSHYQRRTPHGALLAANTRAQAEIGMPSDSPQHDVRGQTLRLLRMQQGWDPAYLATQACISLRQLYQLESGETSLFYSKSLRNQAGRRVATILGSHWDEMAQASPPPVQDKHLKLVSTTATENPAPAQQPLASLEIPLGLSKPAADTLVVSPPVSAQIHHPHDAAPSAPAPRRKLHPFWTLAAWMLAAAGGASTGSALAMFWGVRL